MSSTERTRQPIIRLDDCVGTALVVTHPTGVVYVNQAGGTSFLQPHVEGALVPFGNDVALEGNTLMSSQLALAAFFEGPKHRGAGATAGLDEEDADAIDAILADVRAGSWIKVDRSRLKDSMEAWVHVKIMDESGDSPWLTGLCGGFDPYPRAGVLIWMNSD